MTTTRLHGNNAGRCRAVIHAGLVYAVATDTSSVRDIKAQTRLTLQALEKNLIDAGSDRTCLLQATIYLQDMTMKTEMDAVWCTWIGDEENWPQRACVGADLAGDDLIEIVVTARQAG